jgi:hypothetical protein
MDPSIINVITASPAAALGVMIYVYWNDKKSLAAERLQHTKEKDDLAIENRIERDRANVFGEAVIELATETRIHVANFPKTAEGIVEALKKEHKETRRVIGTAKASGENEGS